MVATAVVVMMMITNGQGARSPELEQSVFPFLSLVFVSEAIATFQHLVF